MKGTLSNLPTKEEIEKDLKRIKMESENGQVYGGKLTAYKKKVHQNMRLDFIKFSLFSMHGEIHHMTLHTLQNIELTLFNTKSNFGIYQERFKSFIKSARTPKDKICKETTEIFLNAVKSSENLLNILIEEKRAYKDFLHEVCVLK